MSPVRPVTAPTTSDHAPPPVDVGALAVAAGLHKVGVRPGFGRYLHQLWARRHFALAYARAKAYSSNQGGYLGQLWTVLTPVLWALLYFVVFGVLLDVGDEIENFPVFLVTGLFIYRFVSSAMNAAAGCLAKNRGLIRSLSFPRALIPLSVAISELIHLLPAIGVLFGLALVSGEPLRLHMLLVVPAVTLAFVFACGLCFISARLVDQVSDLKNLVPFLNRALMYTSGVFFALSRYGDGALRQVMEHQPWAVYLHLGRASLMDSVSVRPDIWAWGLMWAVATFAVGLVFFWQQEARYGRE